MFHRNKNTTTPPISGEGFASRLLVGGFVAFMMVMILSSASAQAASPIAGQQISNQATASYTDSGGMPQTVTSNIVITTVEQVGAYTLTASQTKTAAPGTTVYLPHVLTNTGNGIDSFNISIPQALSDSAKLNSAALYLDNGTGVPSGPALCTTTGTTVCSINSGTLASNATYKFILALVVKATAADGALAAAEVITAIPASSGALLASYPTSGGTGDATYFADHSKTNSDQLTIASNLPIFALQKTFDSYTGIIGSTVNVKVAYTNNGTTGPLYIKDTIGTVGSPTESFQYVAGTAKWSASSTALTDATGGDPTNGSGVTIDYYANTAAPTTTIEALIPSVAAGESGFITFDVIIKAGAPLAPDVSKTSNKAQYAIGKTAGDVDCTVLPCTTGGTNNATLQDTNTASYLVTGSYNVTFVNNDTASTDVSDATISGVNLATHAAVAPGAVVPFNNYVWNTGANTDKFNLTVDPAYTNTFPVGTTFLFYDSTGTLIQDTNSDGIPDTGPLAAGANFLVVMKATIPTATCDDPLVFDCNSTNLTVALKASSVNDGTKTNRIYNQLASITHPDVDLTNAGILGEGAGDTTTVITNVSVAPGSTAYFNLGVKNNGIGLDNFDVDYHVISTIPPQTPLGSAADFAAGSRPAGWGVSIYLNTDLTGLTACTAATLGTLVTNTGAIPHDGSVHLCAVVTTPATGTYSAAGAYNTYFRVKSSSTGASDIKLDTVTLNQSSNLSLTTPGIANIQPGGVTYYPHNLVNNGNGTCGADFTFNVLNNKASLGWTYVLYYDADGSGTFTASDVVIGGGSGSSTDTTPDTFNYTLPSGALAAGAQQKFLVKVQAPTNATSGTVDVITLYATSAITACGTSNTIPDTTTILAGQIDLQKYQSVTTWNGTSCGAAPAANTYVQGTTQTQKPGDCIWYKITARNVGDAPLSDITITDSTPANYTTFGGVLTCTADTATNAAIAALPSPTTVAATVAGGTVASATAGTTAGQILCSKWDVLPASGVSTMEFSTRINP